MKKYLWDITCIILGTLLLAVSFNMFLIPNKIAAGGISGLGIIFYHLYEIPVGLTVFVLNVPLFLLAWIILGWKFVVHSLAGALLLPFMLEFTAFVPVLTDDLLLASVFGGIGVGIGLGLVFRSRGSTGGTAIVAQLINHFFGFSSGQSLVAADLAIIIAAGFIFHPEVALFALLSIFVSSKAIDFVQEGYSFSKAAIIISDKKGDVISEKILGELGRGATFLEGRGAYSGKHKGIILCVVSQSEVTHLKNIVKEIDPTAFVIMSNVGEVLGEGFSRIQ